MKNMNTWTITHFIVVDLICIYEDSLMPEYLLSILRLPSNEVGWWKLSASSMINTKYVKRLSRNETLINKRNTLRKQHSFFFLRVSVCVELQSHSIVIGNVRQWMCAWDGLIPRVVWRETAYPLWAHSTRGVRCDSSVSPKAWNSSRMMWAFWV